MAMAWRALNAYEGLHVKCANCFHVALFFAYVRLNSLSFCLCLCYVPLVSTQVFALSLSLCVFASHDVLRFCLYTITISHCVSLGLASAILLTHRPLCLSLSSSVFALSFLILVFASTFPAQTQHRRNWSRFACTPHFQQARMGEDEDTRTDKRGV